MGHVVQTDDGALEGADHRGALRFAGIPYVAPPVGELRFAPPQRHPGWEGVRDATESAKVLPQVAGAMESLAGGPEPDWSEDALVLNVFTPAADDRRRPVMVWIHGGSFTTGAGSIPWYDGAPFATNGDVVVVTVSYRLGAFGFLDLSHLDDTMPSSGNAGIADQIAALEWVQRNIASFGGDPSNVTIFGESAGGMSVGTLMGTPSAAGLFHRAIAQSGACDSVQSPDRARELTDRLMASLGVGDVAALRAVPADDLLAAQVSVGDALTAERAKQPNGGGIGLPFSPVVDGVLIPRQPLDAIRDGSSAQVPLLVGTTRDEWKIFSLMMRNIEDEETILRRLGGVVDDPNQLVAAYRQAADDRTHDDVWNEIMTDRVFRIPAIRLAEAQAVHQPEHTFMYLFEWASTAFDGGFGSCHALEIPFVFDNLDRNGVTIFTGDDPPQQVADTMHQAWHTFARNGSPAHDGVPEWPPYDTASRATMHFGDEAHLEHDPGAESRAAWDGRR